MKNLTIILLCFLTFLLSSCDKDKQEVTPTTPVTNTDTVANAANSDLTLDRLAAIRKIDKITTSSGSEKYTYDVLDRCVRVDENNVYTTYNYGVNKVVATTVFSAPNKPNLVKTYTLNNLGLATQCTYTSSNKSYILDYQYNDRMQITKRILKSKAPPRTIYTTEYTDTYTYDIRGNCDFMNHKLNFVSLRYEYLHDQNRPNTVGNENKGLDWLGKGSGNLPIRIITLQTTYNIAPEYKLYWTYYAWTFDSQGYAIRRTETGDFQSLTFYTYK